MKFLISFSKKAFYIIFCDTNSETKEGLLIIAVVKTKPKREADFYYIWIKRGPTIVETIFGKEHEGQNNIFKSFLSQFLNNFFHIFKQYLYQNKRFL